MMLSQTACAPLLKAWPVAPQWSGTRKPPVSCGVKRGAADPPAHLAAGAFSNSSDALVSSSSLLQLLAAQPSTRKSIMATEVQRVLQQVR